MKQRASFESGGGGGRVYFFVSCFFFKRREGSFYVEGERSQEEGYGE